MPRTQARSNTKPVRSTRQFVESEEAQIPQGNVRAMKSRGPAREALEPSIVEPAVGPVSKAKLDMLAFMEESVKVLVHDTTNPLDAPMPEIQVNGVRQFFKRGEEMVVKRKFVARLAELKKTGYTQEKYKDGNGDDAIKHVPHTALMYPFTVTEDTDKGKAWLRQALQRQ